MTDIPPIMDETKTSSPDATANADVTATAEAAAQETPAPETPRKSSGYRRLKVRHRSLVDEHEAVLAEFYRVTDENVALRAALERRDEEMATLRHMYGELQATVDAVLAKDAKLEADNAKLIEALQAQAGSYRPMQQHPLPASPSDFSKFFNPGFSR